MKRNTVNYLKLSHSVEELTKAQKIDQALDLIAGLQGDDIPKDLKPVFANLTRRLNKPLWGLKILWPEVIDKREHSPEFLLALTGTLRRLGLNNQTRQWLARLPSSPRQQQEKAFNHIQQWEYREAEATLTSLLAEPSLPNDINPLVLKVNLLACQIFLGEADRVLENTVPLLEESSEAYRHLYFNILELRGQAYFSLKKYDLAKTELELASKLVNSKNDPTYLFIRKWMALLKIAHDPLRKNHAELDEVRVMARMIDNWETLRDIDFHLSLLTEDAQLFSKVFFGTPYSAYKQRLHGTRPNRTLPEFFIWSDPRGKNLAAVFDPLNFFHDGLGFGLAEHRLICHLLSDQYRPFTVTRLFDLLFPDELYNPYSSEKRIHNLVLETRSSLQKLGLPIEILSTKGGYRLRPNEKISFKISTELNFADQTQMILHLLKNHFGKNSFNRLDAERHFPFTTDQWRRYLNRLSKDNSLLITGKGKSTRYSIAS